ncbi:MAG: hypothetical protein AAB416_03255 [Patescibacteria group bacterium]
MPTQPTDDEALTPDEQASIDANDRFLADMKARSDARRTKIDGELAALQADVTGVEKHIQETDPALHEIEEDAVSKLEDAAKTLLGIVEEEKPE